MRFHKESHKFLVAPDFQDKIFIVNQGQVQRFDVESLNKQENNKSFDLWKYKTKKLSEIAQLKRWPFWWAVKKEIFVEKWENTYQVYEQYNAIRNDTNRWRYYINEKDYQRLKWFTLESWDIIMSCSWTVWKLVTMPNVFYPWIINQALLRIRLNKDINNKYFNIIFKIIIEELISWNEFAYWGVIKNIASVAELKNIDIPLPPLEIQDKIVEIMETALNKKENKESESKELFNNIDNFILWELWIEYEEVEEKKVFWIMLSELNNSKRLDVNFNNPKFLIQEGQIKNWEYDLVKIWDKFKYINGFAFSSKDYKGEWTKLLTIKNITKEWVKFDNVTYLPKEYVNKFDSFEIQKNDILFAMTGATIWKACMFELDEKVLLNQRCWAIRTDTENPFYLYTVLSLQFYKNEIFRNSWGWAQPNISHNEILNLEIPLPPFEIQEKIAIEVKARIEKANILKAEAKEIYEGAKMKVEEMILGDV